MPGRVGIMEASHKVATGGTLPVSGAVGWWDADSPTSITASGGNVSQWKDKSGQGRHLLNAGANQPDTGIRTMGGRNALYFNSDQLDVSFSLPQPLTIFAMCKLDALNGAWLVYHVGSGTPSILTGSPGAWSLYAGTFLSGAAPTTNPIILTAAFNGASSEMLVNGISAGVGNTGTGPISAFRLGTLVGLISEVVIYPRILTTTERQQVEAYLLAKWVPVPIPDFWWDASDASTITASAGRVSAWNDKSGARHFTQPGATSLQPSTGRTINGLSALDFTGTEFMSSPSYYSETAPVTVCAAVQSDNPGAGNAQYVSNTSANPTMFVQSGFWALYNGAVLSGSTAVNTSPHVVTAVFNAGSSEMFLDGVSKATGDTGNTSWNAPVRPGGNAAGSYYWDGLLAEIRWFSRLLTTKERQAVEADLKTKWGTP